MNIERTEYIKCLDDAKRIINDFCVMEYDTAADFSDLSRVDILCSTIYDMNENEIPLQVSVDLVRYAIDFRFNGEETPTLVHKYHSLGYLMIWLYNLDFDELVGNAEMEYESNRRNNLCGIKCDGIIYFGYENEPFEED